MAAHTPGPWEVHASGLSILASEIEAGENTRYRPRTCLANLAVDNVANARLIAAAPELLAALDTVVGQVWDLDVYGEEEMRARMRRIGQIARAAIAKATGKP